MEVVGAAASVAGIVAFASQTAKGLVKLSGFISDMRKAPKLVKELKDDISGLLEVVLQIESLLTPHTENASEIGQACKPSISMLGEQISKCHVDVQTWIDKIAILDVRPGRGLMNLLRRTKQAAKSSFFLEISQKITSYKIEFNMSLSMLGRALDSLAISKIDTIDATLEQLTEENLAYSRALSRSVVLSNGSIHDSLGSIRGSISSLSSIVSTLTREIQGLKAHRALPVRRNSAQSRGRSPGPMLVKPQLGFYLEGFPVWDDLPGLPWSCGAISGLDDAITNDTACMFCGMSMYHFDPVQRGIHLIQVHFLWQCDMDIAFVSYEGFWDHMREHHQAQPHAVFSHLPQTLRITEPYRYTIGMPDLAFSPDLHGVGGTERLLHVLAGTSAKQKLGDDPSPHAVCQYLADYFPHDSFHFRQDWIEAACIAEHMVVLGHSHALFEAMTEEFEEIERTIIKLLSDTVRTPVFDQHSVCKSHDRPCSCCQAYASYDSFRLLQTPEIDDIQFRIREMYCTNTVEVFTRLRRRSRARLSPPSTVPNMVDLWMLQFFIESAPFRDILRSTAVASGLFPRWCTVSWIGLVLASWHNALSSCDAKVQLLESGGAVDSRDGSSDKRSHGDERSDANH